MNYNAFQKCCILCGSRSLHSELVCEQAELVGMWRKSFGIDVQAELHAVNRINKWYCDDCSFVFYDPILAGSENLYRELQKSIFYYMQGKWEHAVVLPFFKSGMFVLEVGCGTGSFLEKLSVIRGITCNGLELNSDAVEIAKSKGLAVHKQDLHSFASTYPQSFDVVASFQVLEHLPDPRAFLSNCITVLKPGGILLVGVPNNAGFLRHTTNDLLNMPPHHIGLFTPDVFRAITRYFDITLESILFEPLADYHTTWYCNVQIDKLLSRCYMPWRIVKTLRRTLPIILTRLRLQRLLTGHTMLAVFRKV